MSRIWKTVLPDNTAVTNEFYPTGQLKKTYGSGTYPVAYGYDIQGRMTNMQTWQDFAGNSGVANTHWAYTGHRGWLTQRSGETGPAQNYTYTAAGRLLTGGNGTTLTYGYNNAGELRSIDTGVTNTYDRRGRKTQIVKGTTTTTLTYNDAGQQLVESYSGGPLNGISVTNSYDAYLRRTNVASIATTGYEYDAASRLSRVTDGTNSASYRYIANSGLLEQIAFTNMSTLRLVNSNQYDYLGRLTLRSSATSAVSVLSFAYQYNSANQRTRLDLGGTRSASPTYWAYGYDQLGQVTSSKKYWSDATPVAGQQFVLTYDDIGNRKTASFGGDAAGTNLHTATYTVNLLNQYTNRTVPGWLDVVGSLNSNATLLVNGTRAYRYGEYFWSGLTASNTTAQAYLNITNVAFLNNGTNADYATTNIGHLLMTKTPEVFGYDLDGNMTSNGRFPLTWDGENRLTGYVSYAGTTHAAAVNVAMVYDGLSRRIQKVDAIDNGSAWVPVLTNRFVYDGWNLISVLNNTNGLLYSFHWGNDVSGSPQGAGGCGGLISMTVHTGTNAGTYLYCYDGNENVIALVNATTGEVAAQYEYGPFGELLRATGPMAFVNPFRFSTKYQDDESGYLYYGYRYYDPNTGRWLSRDPIEEKGGLNLSLFNNNDGINFIDNLGLLPLLPYFNTNHTWDQAIQPYINTLNGAFSHIKCCDRTAVLLPSLTGSASGKTVSMAAKYLPNFKNGNVEVLNFFWWDCFSAQIAAYYQWSIFAPSLPKNWQEYGWRLGGDKISDTKTGHVAVGSDPFDVGRWNWRVRIVYIYCENGYKHVKWVEASERIFDWNGTGWVGPHWAYDYK